MTTADRARVLMMQHHHTVKNRQQAMLERSGFALGMPSEVTGRWNSIQGKLDSSFRATYDRTGVTLS